MKVNVFDGEVNQCYGCGACSQVCPKNSITMVPNSEGFLFPLIDCDTCTVCNLCQKVCPVIEENVIKTHNLQSTHVYAGWNNDLTQIMESTSAAIFPLLAKSILNKGGVVYGCAWADDELRAIHIRVTKPEDLFKLKGSKYVQSSTENTFQKVKEDLKNGLQVLYSGTGCQIAGLKLFIGNRAENLFTIDLVCHGTPSPKMLSAYISFIEKKENSKIISLKFRDKKKSGWRSYISWVNVRTSKKAFRLGGLEPYMFGFYNEFINRESCYLCRYSSGNRPGDITLSDYWGVEKSHPELNNKHKYGINMIMCNSEKGIDLFSDIKLKITYVESKLEYAQKGDSRLLRSGNRPKLRNRVYKDLNDHGFTFLAETYLKPRFYFIRRLIPSWVKNITRSLK